MRYLSGIAALNLVCPLDTDGDWHHSAIDWENALTLESTKSIFGKRGLYISDVPCKGRMHVANHIRALADLMDKGYFSNAQGMREDIINNENLTPVLFEMIYELSGNSNWSAIDRHMGKEYGCDWLEYKSTRERDYDAPI